MTIVITKGDSRMGAPWNAGEPRGTANGATEDHAFSRVLVEVGKLKVNPRVNTREVRRQAPHLKALWQPWLCEDLHIAPIGGDAFEVIEGGTRMEAMRELGYTHVYCRVHWWADNEERRARLFFDLDAYRVALSTRERFQALITAADPESTAVSEVLAAHGWRLGRHVGRREVSGVANLLYPYRWGVLGDLLDLLDEVWPDQAASFEPLMTGLGAFLHVYGGVVYFRRPRLVSVLRRASAAEFNRLGRTNAATAGKGAKWHGVYDLARIFYNRQLPIDDAGRLPERAIPRLIRVGAGSNLLRPPRVQEHRREPKVARS